MAAEIDSHSSQVEASGIAPNMAILFQHAHSSKRAAPQLKRRAQARGAGPQNHDVRLVHEFKNAKGLLTVSGAPFNRPFKNFCVLQ